LAACSPASRHAETPEGTAGRILPPGPKHLELARPALAPSGSPSKILRILRTELDRNFGILKKQPNSNPYFLAYESIDEDSVSITSSLGSLVTSDADHSRSLDVDIRLGTPKLDNTHRLRGAWDSTRDFTRIGWLPLEDDAGAVSSVAWLTTHAEYERALEDLVRVQANKQVLVDEEDVSDDFSVEAPVTYHGPEAHLAVDVPAWEARLQKLSAAFRTVPEILESEVQFEASAETRYLVTSEGTDVQEGRLHGRILVTASTTADDGMRLERTETLDAPSADRLPPDAAIEALVQTVIKDLLALRKAPPIEPYAGPAILDGRAAGVFFHEIFGHRVEGHRQKDEEEGQTFSHQIGEPVMPAFLDVFDDPSAFSLNGTPLNGFYPYDDEGVRGARVPLVEDGKLRNFLLSRSPATGFPHSNGHGRRAHGHRVVSRQGNLVVDPAVTTTREGLTQALLDDIRREKKPYGLYFQEITGGYTNTTRGSSQAFKVLPVMVYKIYPDGRQELVRGVDLEGTPLAALARIEAAANDFGVFNGVCGAESGWVPVSATSPSILLGQIEVTRREKSHDRPPLLPPPAIDAAKTNTVKSP
jgi:predicted Zn-dependent protease